jgi:hypothetical protein
MTYASTSIDRRAIYYARAANVIAADPLDFYTRAERGRRFQVRQLNAGAIKPEEIVSHYLSQAARQPLMEPARLHR